MHQPLIVVVRFSAAFGDAWRALAEGLGLEVRVLAPGDVRAVPRAAAVLLVAPGIEREVIEWLEGRERCPGVSVFVVGSDPGRRVAAQVVGRGASDYFAFPEDAELLHSALAAAVSRYRSEAMSDKAAVNEATAFADIVGESPEIKSALRRAGRLLHHPCCGALLLGESGTGKELLARAIHGGRARGSGPFVPVNCTAFQPDLFEQELFGHEKGAPPDAYAASPGLFELADGGTLLLKEVGALSLDVQAKLLDALETQEVRRLGGTRPRTVDVRVIATSSDDLRLAVRQGTFRRDLLLRIGAVTLELLPLRLRGNDVVLVADHLLTSLAELHQLPIPELRGEALRVLWEYSWPGNIRELKHALERALLLSPRGSLTPAELVPEQRLPTSWTAALPFPAQLDDITSAAARATLEACGGNVSRAARQLAVSRGRLRRLIRPSGIPAAAGGRGFRHPVRADHERGIT